LLEPREIQILRIFHGWYLEYPKKPPLRQNILACHFIAYPLDVGMAEIYFSQNKFQLLMGKLI